MPKYLIKAKYTPSEGVKGLIADGATGRIKAVSELMTSLGGKVESFYYAFGEIDAYVIVEAPDNASIASMSLTVGASGLATTEVVALLTAEEVDAAVKKSPLYDAPGPNA